ncbi:hypothetical protein BJ165DRAFT_1521923 [Panaeolus papilionaceus]|nr:hypothetical protein BJ165DRAFT_1521923 [Panaeolus papilionaceus]
MSFSRPFSPSMFALQIGFIGLGNMGYCMARNLARCLHSSLELPVGSNELQITETLEQIALECDVIIVSLADDAVVRSVYQCLTDTLKVKNPTQPKTLVETGTIYPMLAGELDSVISLNPILPLNNMSSIGYTYGCHVGRTVKDLGGDLVKGTFETEISYVSSKYQTSKPRLAPTFKLIANSMILGQLEIMAETFTFAEMAGISTQTVYSVIQDYFPAPSILAYTQKMINEQFDGEMGFSIDGGIKDATHIRRLTAKHNAPMPAIDVAYQYLVTVRVIHTRKKNEGEKTWDKLDWSSTIAGTRAAAGLNGFRRFRTQDPSIVEVE